MEQNTPELWDQLWKNPVQKDQDLEALAREEQSVRWRRLEEIVLREFGKWTGLRVIELGAGAGTHAALMAKRGARVSVLDYSPSALARAQEFFSRNGLPVETKQHNALSLPRELMGSYDISMSFGLTEHFKGEERFLINKAHWDVLKKGGIAFISVPNRYNPPYRIFKFLAELLGLWKVGEEYPYSRAEFRRICARLGVREYSFFGDSLIRSFGFLSPVKAIRKLFRLPAPSTASLCKERGTFLDQYLSYALVLCAKRGSK